MNSQQVYFKATYDVIDLPGFWRKLKRFLGLFRIEQQSIHDAYRETITISFFTDKIRIPEGKDRQVEIIAKSNSKGSWYFTRINYIA